MRTPKRTLAIETATEACSIALFDGESLVAGEHHILGRGHAERLVPMIAGLPGNGRADRILVSLGPGSFTGVRIGIAAARALGFAWSAQVLGYPTLALVAAQAQQDRQEGVTVCMTGGHGEWFVQDFDVGTHPLGPMVSVSPGAAAERGAQPLIVGSKARDFAILLGAGHCSEEILPNAAMINLLPETLLGTDLAPIYGRGPDATPQKMRRTS